MGKLQSILTARGREVYVKMSLLLLLGVASESVLGQCPTDFAVASHTSLTNPTTAGSVCSNVEHFPANESCSIFDITNLPYSGDPACPVRLTFTPQQGCGDGKNITGLFAISGTTCTPIAVPTGGIVTIDVASTSYSIMVCRPGNGPASLTSFTSVNTCCTAPVIACPANVTVRCGALTTPAETGTATYTNGCGNVVVTFADADATGVTCPVIRKINRVWTATDANLQTSTCTQTISITDQAAPVITCPAAVTVSCAALVATITTTATATDDCDANVAISVNPVESDRTCANRYKLTRNYTATDDCGNTSTCSQVITVDDQTPPVFNTGTAILPAIACGVALPTATESVYTATDNCTGLVTVVPSAWTPDVTAACSIKYKRTWTATDACMNTSSVVQYITQATSGGAITFGGTLDLGTLATCTTPLPLNTQNVLTASNTCGALTGPPSNWVLDGTTNCVALYKRTWIATDGCGNTGIATQMVSRREDNTAPVFTGCPGNTTVSCASEVPTVPVLSSVTATDNCPGTLTIVYQGETRRDGSCANRYALTRTWTATDACNNTAICTQIITVNDVTAPMITCPAAITVACASEVPAVALTAVTATDNCGGIPTITHNDADDITTTGICANRFILKRVYRATDACGNTATCAQVITVKDETAPILTGTATLPNIACGATLPTATESVYTAADACAGDVTVRASAWVLDATSKICTGSIYKRIWTATDACGNASTKQQTIQMNPPTLPTMTAPGNITGICGSLPASTQITFTNGATGDCALSGLSELSTFSTVPACAGTVIETWKALDACGRYLAPVSRTITCNTGLSCATEKVKDANCDGFNGSATVTLKGGVASAYKWDNDETTATATALSQGLHSVTVTSTAGCITICNVAIGNTMLLNGSVVENHPASCKGANGSATVTPTGGTTNIRFVWDNQETSATATHLTAGTHMVKMISGNCVKMLSVEIGSASSFTCSAGAKKAASCADNDGSATVEVDGKDTYTYSWDNGETTAIATQLSSGVHRVTVTNAKGCESTCSVTIGSPAITLYCTTTQTATTATVTILGGNGTVTILWDNGETTATAVHLTPGVHTVVLTDQAGCTTGCSVTMAGDALACTTSAVKHLKCSKEADGSAKVMVTGGSAPYKILWDNGETTAIATHLNIGVHSVTVTDNKGQTTTCSISIGCTAAELTMAACTKTDVTCKGENTGSVTAGAVQGTGNLQYTWKNSSNKVVGTTATVQNLPADTYTLIVQNGCSSAACDVTVLQPTEVCEEKEYHFYPAATTCCTYTNGSSQPLKYIGYKSNEHVTEVNPNGFYYYAKIVAPSKDFTVNIVQTKDESTFKFLGLSNDQIQLWDANCAHSVKGLATGKGQGNVSIKNAKIGSTYVLAVRLDTKTLLKTACKKDAPKVTYTIASYINQELVAGSKGSIHLKPNHEQVRLNAGKCPKRAPEHDSQTESLVNKELLVQPNPAQSAVNVVFESVSAEMSVISVSNVNGAIVQTMNHEAKQGENNVSLDIQQLPVGTYIVTVKTAHQWMTKQLVILR
jgi:Secretion system C-terminal sorting domain/SprB repeat